MDRLLKGEPIRSDGSLTGVALAAESGVPRWKLYDEYRDLLNEFRARVALQDNTPRAIRDLLVKHAKQHSQLKKRYARNRDRLAQSVADVKRLSCIVNVLALENAQLKERLREPNPRVTPLNRQERLRNGGSLPRFPGQFRCRDYAASVSVVSLRS